MYYIHFDNNGRPDLYTGWSFKNKQEAIEKAKELTSNCHVSKGIKIQNPWGSGIVDGFDKPCFSKI